MSSIEFDVLQSPRNVSVPEGGRATFTCRTHLELHRHTSWVRLMEGEIVELSEGTEAFTVENATEEDAGVYACVVGTDEGHIQVRECATLLLRMHSYSQTRHIRI